MHHLLIVTCAIALDLVSSGLPQSQFLTNIISVLLALYGAKHSMCVALSCSLSCSQSSGWSIWSYGLSVVLCYPGAGALVQFTMPYYALGCAHVLTHVPHVIRVCCYDTWVQLACCGEAGNRLVVLWCCTMLDCSSQSR